MTGIETIIEAEAWRRALPAAVTLAERCFEAARERDLGLDGEIALLLADDAALQALNARFRGKDAPTNVLSFPSTAPGVRGDIALAYETCAREAAEKNVAFADHAAHLIVHGLLHLAGLDHQTDADAAAMERLEIDILDGLGISNPYGAPEGLD
ncbi:MAG: rRNA maturation RNase YbeY [Parvularculaceae bacterium]